MSGYYGRRSFGDWLYDTFEYLAQLFVNIALALLIPVALVLVGVSVVKAL